MSTTTKIWFLVLVVSFSLSNKCTYAKEVLPTYFCLAFKTDNGRVQARVTFNTVNIVILVH